ncbi:MAG: TIR domain-containing protein [Clostridia bacterium]|nr:TIR domain-containing protein [Clostridia bacterium]
MGYAFISYSTKNQASADAIRELFNKHNIDTWMAPYNIPAGSKYASVITKAIRECSCFVLLLSNDSQASEAVGREVELAAIYYKKSIITLELEKVVLNDEFTFYIHNRQIIAVKKIDENSLTIKQILEVVSTYTNIDDKLIESIDNHQEVSDNCTEVQTEPVSECIDTIQEEDNSTVNKAIDNFTNNSNEHSNELSTESKQENDDFQVSVDDINTESNLPSKDIEFVSENDNETTNIEETIETNDVTEEETVIEGIGKELNTPHTTDKYEGYLVGSFGKAQNIPKEKFINPFRVLGPYCNNLFFEFCDEFTINDQNKSESNRLKYSVVSQINDKNECLFFIFKNKGGKITLLSEGQEQNKVYRWFREKHRDKYVFTDETNATPTPRKKNHFAQDTALKIFSDVNNIPQILVIPDKYEHISSNAFAKLNPKDKEIRQIIIPDSVEIIDDSAFAGLVVTEAVYITEGVKKIGKNAFVLKKGAYVYFTSASKASKAYCSENNAAVIEKSYKRTTSGDINKVLDEISKSSDITRIKYNTIPNSTPPSTVDEIIIPKGVCVIDDSALQKAKVKKRIVIPSSVTKIGANAFDLLPEAYIECTNNSYAYFYCKENNLRNSVDIEENIRMVNEQKMIINNYKAQGVCIHCGGKFSGLLKKKCSICGKEKDY